MKKKQKKHCFYLQNKNDKFQLAHKCILTIKNGVFYAIRDVLVAFSVIK